jgi:phage gp29-like protein
VVEPVEMDSAMDTDSDEEDFSIEDKFAGDVTPRRARELLEETEPGESEEQAGK